MDRAVPTCYRPLVVQCLIVLTGLMLFAVMPPARGDMIAVPLFPSQRTAGMAGIIDTGARIIRAGPVDGSLIVHADRNAIISAALLHGILLLPTTMAGCQSAERQA